MACWLLFWAFLKCQDTLSSLDKLAHLCLAMGHVKDAAERQRDAVERRRQKLGPEHVDSLRSTRVLAEYLKLDEGHLMLVEAHQLLMNTKSTAQRVPLEPQTSSLK